MVGQMVAEIDRSNQGSGRIMDSPPLSDSGLLDARALQHTKTKDVGHQVSLEKGLQLSGVG